MSAGARFIIPQPDPPFFFHHSDNCQFSFSRARGCGRGTEFLRSSILFFFFPLRLASSDSLPVVILIIARLASSSVSSLHHFLLALVIDVVRALHSSTSSFGEYNSFTPNTRPGCATQQQQQHQLSTRLGEMYCLHI